MIDFNHLDLSELKEIGIFHKGIIGFFTYGSTVYGTKSPNSDIDFLLVDKNLDKPEDRIRCEYDFNIYSEKMFVDMLEANEISALECMYLPPEFVICNNIDRIPQINLGRLRSAISQKASNSFVKCKKKLEVENDFYIGKKSLWHSLRILIFGIQLAKYKRIVDYSAANHLWDEIVLSPNKDWKYFKEKYQPTYNELSTEFRKLAPKEL